MILIGTKSTNNNYTRLDLSYLSTPNIYYSISAFNNGNGTLISTGDVIILAPPGGLGEEVCSSKCNGKSYAWKLSYVTAPNNGPGKMTLNSTVDYYDNLTGIVTPFWQAVGQWNYELMEDIQHPYTEIADNYSGTGPIIYTYKHKPITASLLTLMGPLFDKNNNPVYDGYLIEKKMDQFSYMETSGTKADPGIGYCSFETNAWMNFYNTYNDPSTNLQPNADYLFFAPTLPTQLLCEPGGSLGGGSGGSGISEHYEWNQIISDWFDCVWENYENGPTNNYIWECTDLLLTVNGNSITGFEFEQIDKPALNPSGSLIVGINNDGSTNILSQVGQIGTGLYNVYVYTINGKMLSSVYEIPEKIATKRSRDYVKLEIAPNRIENDVLKFKISSEKDLPVTITVHKLNGQLIHNETTSLSKVIDLQREIALSNGSTPYNQIRVTLTFADGSSIQQTAIKL